MTSRKLHKTSKSLLEKHVPDCMYSPFDKIIYMLSPPTAYLGQFLSYLRCFLPVSSPHFAPHKTQFATLMLWILSRQPSCQKSTDEESESKELVAQSCPTLCNSVDCSLPGSFLCPRDSPGKNTGVSRHLLLHEIFLTQGSNPGFLHCKKIL